MVRQFLSVASFKTASRCWMPTTQAMARSFSSKQRFVNFGSIELEHVNLISNDDVLHAEETGGHAEVVFEPTVHSSEEIFTAGPVNKA